MTMDKHIQWKIGRGEVSMWYDNWLGIGALWTFFAEGRIPINDNLSKILLNGHWQWGGWDLYLPDHVINHINSMQINPNPNMKDKAIWTPDAKGSFTISSTWNIMIEKRDKSWINAMN